ncbi:MAG TPA: hypothetical protein VG993_03490 [Actinomycetota bacterium]|nr:hypothetical protein [Actinomycetota bacterium]
MEAIARVRRSLFVALAVALVAGACSSGGSPGSRSGDRPPIGEDSEPLARVISASDRAIEAESMHLTFEIVLSGSGQEIRGSGEADIAFGGRPRQHMVFRYDSFPGMPDGLEMEMIMDGSMLYLRMPQMQGLGSLPTEWVSMDASKSVPGFDDLTGLGAGQNDPSNAFGYLQGAEEAEDLGTETIDGVETTHYEVTVDVAGSIAEVPPELRDEMRSVVRRFREQFGTTSMPFEVWVDADGLPRRMVYRVEADGPAGPFSMEMTMDITEYGNEFELEIPSPGDVTDVTRFVEDAAA